MADSQPVVEALRAHEIVLTVDTVPQNLVQCGFSGVRCSGRTLKHALSVGRKEGPESRTNDKAA